MSRTEQRPREVPTYRYFLAGALTVGLLVIAPQLYAQYQSNPRLPLIPEVTGPVHLKLTYPEPGMVRPGVSRNFIFGTTSTGDATLTINGDTTPVAPNGAFLAFLSVPANGIWVMHATRPDGTADTLVYFYDTWRAGPGDARRVRDVHEHPRLGIVTSGADTLASGSGIAYAAPTPTADREWMFPRGARFPVFERDGGFLRIGLGGRSVWVEEQYVTVGDHDIPETAPSIDLLFRESQTYTDVVIPVEFNPFRITTEDREITLDFYGASTFLLEQQTDVPSAPGRRWVIENVEDPVVQRYSWTGIEDVVQLQLQLRSPLWGYKAFYNDEGNLVLRLRRPPDLDRGDPIRGLRVVIDPGHPPRGANGPTGLTEAEANLNIALALERLLRSRGAEVILTRRDSTPLVSDSDVSAELTARVDFAVSYDPHILVSVHNNGLSDGTNPWEKNGTETYYYHAFSSRLAETLHEELVEATGVEPQGFKQRSLALARPTWAPSVLTESLYMMHPQQEAALMNPEFVERLARAHLEGIERFLLDRLQAER